VTLAGCAVMGCLSPPSKAPKKAEVSNTTLWTLSSDDFTSSGAIPAAFTCAGSGKNPELDWNAGPDGTQSYAVVLKDISIIEQMPDPVTLSSAYYWALWNVPATTLEIPRGVSASATPPEVEGATQWSAADGSSYVAPCPNGAASEESATPVTHHFAFTLYALSTPSVAMDLDGGANFAETLDQHLKTVALGDVNLLFTSDASVEMGGGGAGGSGAGGAASE